MAEYKVRVWRRQKPNAGDPTRIIGLEHDEVSLEAPSEKSALDQVIDAERKEGSENLRVYVQIHRPGGGHLGIGDFVLCELAFKEDQECQVAGSDSNEK